MPAAYNSCLRSVKQKGMTKNHAHAVCTSVNAGNIRATRKAERLSKRAEKGHDLGKKK
jgi:hypothetical protein